MTSRPFEVRTMRPMQEAAFKLLFPRRQRIVNAPTGSGKSMLIAQISARELAEEPHRKVVISVPQTVIAKGFRDCDLVYPDGMKREWRVGYDLCVGTERKKIHQVRDFFTATGGQLRHHVLLCSHTSLARAYNGLPNRRRAIRDTSFWIDEAHHVLVADSPNAELPFVCNQLGNLVRYVIDRNDPTTRIGLATAFFFRGDRVSIIPQRYLERFTRFHLPLDEHWEKHIKHIKAYSYDFVVYKDSYYKEITALFRQRLGKTLIYVPWPNTDLARRHKYEDVKRIEEAIRMVRPKAKILDLVDEEGRATKKTFVESIQRPGEIDVIIALGLLREGADWVWADRIIDLAPSDSLQLQGQKFGRLLRDVPGKSRIEYYNLLPLVMDTLDAARYRRVLSDRFAAFTASVLLDDLITPIKFPRPLNRKCKKPAERINWFSEAVPDEAERDGIFREVVTQLITKGAQLERSVDQGQRDSATPRPDEVREVVTGVLERKGVHENTDEIYRHIIHRLAHSGVKQPSIDVQSIVDSGFDLVVKYAYQGLLAFGARQCGLTTFRQFYTALHGRDYYATPEEWKKAVDRLGITSVPEYRQQHKQDPRLYRNPDKAYGLAWNKLMVRSPLYKRHEEWRAAVRRLKIRTVQEYRERHRQDPRLPSSPMKKYKMTWSALIGRQYYATTRKCGTAIRALCIRSYNEYAQRYKEDPMFPSNPMSHYDVAWNKLVGRKAVAFYALSAWRKAVAKHKVKSIADYKRARKHDPRLHSIPWSYYGIAWKQLMNKK